MRGNRSERIALAGIALGLYSFDDVADVLAARQRWDGDPGRAPPILGVLRARGLLDPDKERLLEELVRAKNPVRLAGYEIFERIGRGGMGVVYRARHVELERDAAVKVLASKWKKEARFVEQFLQEARAVGKLRHPNIVTGYDAGQDRGVYYVAMELVDGESLHARIRARGRLPEKEALEIARQVASALDHAHAHGFVHRDVKPPNVLFTSDGVAKLCDLGLVRAFDGASDLVATGGALGTLAYAPPEQLRDATACDIRGDVYALGATLYQMLTGELPFPLESPAETLRRRLEEPIPDPARLVPGLSAAVQRIVRRCLEPDPARRFQEPAALEREIARARDGAPAPQSDPAAAPDPLRSPRRPLRRRRLRRRR